MPKLIKITKNVLIKKYIKNKSAKEIATKLKVNKCTILRKLHKFKIKIHSREEISKMQSEATKKMWLRPDHRDKMRKAHLELFKGKNNPNYKHGKYCKDYRNYCINCKKEIGRLSEFCQSCSKKGNKNHFYIDGRTSLHYLIRNSKEYNLWRKDIFKRDNYTCYFCGKMGKEIHPHHNNQSFREIFNKFLSTYSRLSPIKDKEILLKLSVSYAPFWDIDNGITLCKSCHFKTKNYGRPKRK